MYNYGSEIIHGLLQFLNKLSKYILMNIVLSNKKEI